MNDAADKSLKSSKPKPQRPAIGAKV